VRKNGELDRELKKIVKDYGEYDLYSRQRPINLRTGGIAAVLLLGGLLAGFYFFYSPNTAAVDHTPEAGSTAVPSPLESGSSKEPVDKGETGLSGRNGTSEESPRAVETITPQ
jgi:hypothetical protein